jgi:hypothetical protein
MIDEWEWPLSKLSNLSPTVFSVCMNFVSVISLFFSRSAKTSLKIFIYTFEFFKHLDLIQLVNCFHPKKAIMGANLL